MLVAAVGAVTLGDLRDQVSDVGARADRRAALPEVVAAAGGRDALVDCARVRTAPDVRPLVAWELDISMLGIDRPPAAPARCPALEPARRRADGAGDPRRVPAARPGALLGGLGRVYCAPLMDEIAIVVHGGAGGLPRDDGARVDRMRAGAAAAVEAGHAVLAGGGTSLEAVEAAVVVLEDDPEFNAGRGAALTEYGRVELDASMMDGTSRAAGAVAAVRGVRNPIRAARAVLEEGRHVLLVGAPATEFAATAGLDFESETWFVTERERLALANAAEPARGTVGAVARDAQGRLAAATSTGGVSGQRLGRVGDSPLIGAGTWADDATVAVSCTGHGESIIRSALAHEVDALLRHRGLGLEDACAIAIDGLGRWGQDGGLIAVSSHGEVAAKFNSAAMTRGWRVGDGPVVTAVAPGEGG